MLPNPITHQIHLSLNLLVILHKKTLQTNSLFYLWIIWIKQIAILFYFDINIYSFCAPLRNT